MSAEFHAQLHQNETRVNFYVQWKKYPKQMTREEAIKASIKKWQYILIWLKENRDWYEGKLVKLIDGGVVTCALCQKYYHPVASSARRLFCNECPIYVKTGRQFCAGTPYAAIADNYMYGEDPILDFDWTIEKAEEELQFLYSLLEEENEKSKS